MPSQLLVPAAQYVRMSTDDQPNSIPIQIAAIQQYAKEHSYEVVVTYPDIGKSGVEIKNRPGLRQLIQDVISGNACFRVILVYDVSRWGRFQNTDESAHYEFLCRSAGVPIHYCAEQFENDGKLSNEIMKTVKRTMAAEFSRELAVKVSAGLRLIAAQGFRGGSTAGYGLRRMLISSDGDRKQILKIHERKNLKSDHIILVPGPRHEVECVRTIFTLAADERKSPLQIARELNRRQLRFGGDKPWTDECVYRILKGEKYMGSNVWGKTTKPFRRNTVRLPPGDWITKPGAFVPLVSSEQFGRVQKLLQVRNYHITKPDKFYLDGMRRVLAREGRLSQALLTQTGVFNHRAYVRRFGSVLRAYELVGYKPSTQALNSIVGCRKMLRLRADLLNRLNGLFPSQMRIVRLRGQRTRQAIELDNQVRIAIHICPPVPSTVGGAPGWLLRANPREANLAALICLPDKNMEGFATFYMVPEFGSVIRRFKVLREGHPWLAAGKHLESLSEFYEAAKEVLARWTPLNDITRSGDTVFAERASLLTIAGRKIELSRIESGIAKLLVQNAGVVVSRKTLGCGADNPSEWVVSARISALRQKLGKRFRKRIVTVKGEGYVYQIIKTRIARTNTVATQ